MAYGTVYDRGCDGEKVFEAEKPLLFLLPPQALQHRRSQLERMLIAPPHHIEFVDAYVHKGEVEDSLYTSPWLLGGETDILLTEYTIACMINVTQTQAVAPPPHTHTHTRRRF